MTTLDGLFITLLVFSTTNLVSFPVTWEAAMVRMTISKLWLLVHLGVTAVMSSLFVYITHFLPWYEEFPQIKEYVLVTSYVGLVAFDALLLAGSLMVFAGWKEEEYITEADKRRASEPYILWAKRVGLFALSLYLLSVILSGA